MEAKDQSKQRLTKVYKGFEIEVSALPLRGKEKTFTAHLIIRKDARMHVDETLFETGQIFPDVNAALSAGLEIGQQKIDSGFHPKKITINQLDFDN